MSDSLKGKTALIMGAGKERIGNHVAKFLSKNSMNIALHYNTSEKEAKETIILLKKEGIKAESFKADITKEEEIKNLIEEVIKKFGRIDLLVNTAAAYYKKELKETTADDLDFFYKVNLRGTFLTSKYAGLKMKEQDFGGVIINIGDWAIFRPYKDYSSYLASKGSIPTITKTLAVELAPKVRVNCILPGPILFPKEMDEKERKESINKTLLKKQGTPDNIAIAVLHYFINDFVTGDCCFVDGGKLLN